MPLDQGNIEEEEEKGTGSMSFFDHVDELRSHIVRSVIVLIGLVIIAFSYIDSLFKYAILGPINEDFLTYRLLCRFSEWMYQDARLCVDTINLQLTNLQVQGQFMAAFKISLIAGFIASFPYLMWELWRFVKPALTSKEKNMATGLVTVCSLLFFSGVLFGYFVLSPISINFFVSFQISDMIANQPTFQNVVSLITVLSVGTGLLFLLPVLMYFLARLGLLSSAFLKKYRKHAFLIIIILSAIVTPPDVISQGILAIPIYLLYEMGLIVTKRVEAKREKFD